MAYIDTYPDVKQHYLHIIVLHTVQMWRRFGSLVRISNQASEACNWHHDKIVKWLGRQGGFGKPQAEELIEHRLIWLLFMLRSEEADMTEWIRDHYKKWAQQCQAARAKKAEKLARERGQTGEEMSEIETQQDPQEDINGDGFSEEDTNEGQSQMRREESLSEESLSEESFSEESLAGEDTITETYEVSADSIPPLSPSQQERTRVEPVTRIEKRARPNKRGFVTQRGHQPAKRQKILQDYQASYKGNKQ